jgi:hypothetical protein
MIWSQPQFQHVSPQMHVSSSDRFGAGSGRFFLPLGLPSLSGPDLHQSVVSSARFFSPLGMPRSSDSDLQQSGEEGTTSETARNALMDVKEEEAILAGTRALNGEDVPTSKKRGWPSKGGKTSAPPKKKKMLSKEGIKGSGGFGWRFKLRRRRICSEVARLRGRNIDSNLGRGEEEFSRCAKKQGLLLLLLLLLVLLLLLLFVYFF